MALLTVETVPDFVIQNSDKVDFIAADAKLKATEIHGGNLNYAFCVRDESGKAVFVKQAPEFIKVFGPEAKLHKERLKLEVDVYAEWTKVLGKETAARFLPEIYHCDLESMAVIMQFLENYQLLDGLLYKGSVAVESSKQLGEFMAMTHAKTHSSKVDADRASTLAQQFENRKLRDIQLAYVFTKAFEESERAAWLRDDVSFMAELEEIRGTYNGKNKDDLVLLHGDLHPGSVMVDMGAKTAKVIDPEFCIYGPAGLDLGSFISGYILAFIYHTTLAHESALPKHYLSCGKQLRDCIEELWETYDKTMRECGLDESVIARASEDAVAFASCEVARTALGFAGVRGLPFEDKDVKAKAEERAVKLAHRCLMSRKGKGISLLLEELDSYASGGEEKIMSTGGYATGSEEKTFMCAVSTGS
jgi:5-methylthioribose kinase